MDNNINFKGGFLLKKPSRNMWEKIYNDTVPKNRVIINDLYEKDNIFFASKNFYDSQILSYLLSKKNLKFTYYPNVNLKNQFDSYYPEETIKVLDSELAIESRKEMRKFIIPPTQNTTLKSLKYKWKPEDHIGQTMKALNLSSENYSVETKNFITSIYDKNHKLVVRTSPNNQVGINYAVVYPRYSDEKTLWVAIDHHGKIINKSSDIDALASFKKEFLQAVKIDAGRRRAAKNKKFI